MTISCLLFSPTLALIGEMFFVADAKTPNELFQKVIEQVKNKKPVKKESFIMHYNDMNPLPLNNEPLNQKKVNEVTYLVIMELPNGRK